MELINREEYLKSLDVVRKYHTQLENLMNESKRECDKIHPFADAKPDDSISDFLSNNILNALKGDDGRIGITFKSSIRELSNVSKKDFLSLRNIGKGFLNEANELCAYAGLPIIK